MLIEHYDLDIFMPSCNPDPKRLSARALLLADISAAAAHQRPGLRRGDLRSLRVRPA